MKKMYEKFLIRLKLAKNNFLMLYYSIKCARLRAKIENLENKLKK